jgi:oligoendopeptidase F|tara:strand:- start:86 stop:268 length:183 start_codon:yes stop_codon:yes gene_type:complete
MKKPIDQKDIEKDVNRLMSFLNNMDSIDIENVDMDKLEKDIETFKEDIETKYKDYLDDQE